MIRSERSGDIRTITLDRPDRRNALTPAGLDDLSRAIDRATEPVVYLRGAGDAFCAGADLDVVSQLDQDSAPEFARKGQRVATKLESYDGVVVAGIDGAARGGGVELALACDLRVATDAATLAESGVSLGLFGAWGGTARLPEVVGTAAALDIAVTGRVLDAKEAREFGLVTQIVDSPESVATSLATNDAAAMRTIKDLIRNQESQSGQESREARAFAELISAFDPDENL